MTYSSFKQMSFGFIVGGGDQEELENDLEGIATVIRSLNKQRRITSQLAKLAEGLACYDWRSSSGPELSAEESLRKAAFRGSGGYKELRRDVLRHLSDGDNDVSVTADTITDMLGY